MSQEREFAIDTPDGVRIFGILDTNRNANDKVVVLSHGLTSSPHEYIQKIAARYFADAGYDVVRFFYYNEEPDARNLVDCTLKVHAYDLNLVLSHFRDRYRKTYLAGHSYGGLTALIANPDVDVVSFWDSSFTPYEGFWKRDAEYIESLECYKIGWGYDVLVGSPMYDEARNLSVSDSETLACDFRAPAQVILAEKSNENPIRTHLYDSLKGVKELYEVKGAGHLFTEQDTVYDLLDATRSWFETH